MGFIMDGLDAETYDRTYSDRRLVARITGYFRPQLTIMLFVAVLVVLNSLMDTAYPLLIARSLDTLTKLVNRIYDVDEGRILIDGIDVREWSLDALRSQVSTIEQDIFLFSRSITENIAYGLGQKADQAAIEQAAQDAQAHEFILSFKDGYETVIGERGVTLSGGQRQRLAIARALLTDPRILILDDSTSAIDSATEDEIQKAIRRLLQGRTTLLITHRLSQIRWADKILMLRQGELVDQGTHTELLNRCELYRRIFMHYDSLPGQEPERRLYDGSARQTMSP